MPKNYLAGIFGRSPVRPLQEHMTKVSAAHRELVPFVEAALAGDWERAAGHQARITDLEHEADRLKKDIRLHLPDSLFMPVARADLLDMLTMQYNIANKAKDVAGLMLGRRMQPPPDMGAAFLELVKRTLDATAQAEKTVGELDELFETGFRGAEVEIVESMLKELDAIESDTDRLQVALRARVFAVEKSLHPIDVMFLYEVVDWLGDLGDLAQRVGSRLQLLLAR
jgi:predicted phosphate transport protein (TIGR00153 family)